MYILISLKYNIKNNGTTKTYVYFKPTERNNLDDIKLLIETDDRFNVNNDSYKNVTDYIYRIINNSGFLCRGLNPDYILDSFDTADAVVIIGSSINILPNGNIYGFALINFDETHNSIYIDVICSHIGIKSAGNILIEEIQQMCEKLFMTKIYLTSVNSAISFYEKYGFTKKDNLCEDMCLMIKYINKKSVSKTKKSSKSIKPNKIKTKTTKKTKTTIKI